MKMIAKILKNAAQWKWHLVLATTSLLLVTGINLVTPIAVRYLLKLIGSPNMSSVAKTIWIMTAVLLGLYIFRVLLQYLSNYFAHIAAWRMVAKMRSKVYSHLQTLSMGYYSDKQTGQLMSRVIEDTANFEVLIAHALPDLITSIIVFGGVLGILFYINPVLAAFTCIPLPLIGFTSFFVRRMHKHFSKRQIISAELNSALQDNFSGMKEIQIFNRQHFESEKIDAKAQEHAGQTLKGLFWVALMHPIMNFLSGLGTLAVVLFGGLWALTVPSSADAIADIATFLLYLGLFYTPVATFARVLEDIQTALVSGKRVFEILETKSAIVDSPDAIDAPILSGAVRFDNVSFDYNKDIALLNKVSFEAKAGQMIALVGATGAGKTTITSLLLRFYDVGSGSISIDNIDIRSLTMASLRNQISMVTQDVFLFNGTISQNIAYGRTDEVCQEDIIQAAKTASVHDFIEGLPDKYETKIGERGVRLSGGQKQRIAIARAILRQAPILILDEATSAVDNETEREIQNAINSIAGKRTIIVIAHRLSTVEKADQILVLNNGEIVERGTHNELIAKNGFYANSCNISKL